MSVFQLSGSVSPEWSAAARGALFPAEVAFPPAVIHASFQQTGVLFRVRHDSAPPHMPLEVEDRWRELSERRREDVATCRYNNQ